MPENADLSGRWAGHYSQHGTNHPISADFTQSGQALRGRMRDSDTVSEKSVFETALDAGLPPGADEQIEHSLRELFPDARAAPVRVTSQLPSESLLEGFVFGRMVSFRKTYQGEHFVGYQVGGHRVGTTVAQHVVHYEGRLGDDGRSIEGRWWIEQDLSRGVGRAEGTFELRRT
jgi:hypothetical protein